MVDREDDPEITHPQPPEGRSLELLNAGRPRVEAEREDRAAELRCRPRRQASELALGGGSELDAVTVAHPRREP